MIPEANSVVNDIEVTLSLDDSDPAPETFGSSEKEVARAILILIGIPSIAIPTLFHALRKNIYIAFAIVFLHIVFVFAIIQYQFHIILWISEHIRKCMNTSFV